MYYRQVTQNNTININGVESILPAFAVEHTSGVKHTIEISPLSLAIMIYKLGIFDYKIGDASDVTSSISKYKTHPLLLNVHPVSVFVLSYTIFIDNALLFDVDPYIIQHHFVHY
eukprot:464504_1